MSLLSFPSVLNSKLRSCFDYLNLLFRQFVQLIHQPFDLTLQHRRVCFRIALFRGEDAVNLGETTAAAEDLTQSPDCDREVFPES